MFCPYCGKVIDESQTCCQHCGARLLDNADPLIAADVRSKTPWEDRETIGFFYGLLKTVRAVLFTPADFFRNMRVHGGLTDPLLFAVTGPGLKANPRSCQRDIPSPTKSRMVSINPNKEPIGLIRFIATCGYDSG